MSDGTTMTVPAGPFPAGRLIEATYLLGDDPVLVVEWHTRRILACNDAVTRIFGFKPDELLGQTTRTLHVSAAAFEAFGLESETSIQSGHTSYHCQYRMRRKDGTEFPTEHLVQLITYLDQGSTVVVSFIRDLSGCFPVDQWPEESDIKSAHALSLDIPGLAFRRIRDVQGQDRYTYIAGRLLDKLEVDPAAAQANPNVLFDLIESGDRQLFENAINSSMKSRSGIDLVLRLRSPNGGWFWIRTISRPMEQDDGSTIWDGVAIDISAEKDAQSQASWLANHDGLTGLLNRPEFLDQLERALKIASRGARHVAVAYLGVRGMLKINEAHGLDGGDGILRQIADRLLEALPEGDTPARSHGDVFLVTLDVTGGAGDLATAVQRVHSAFQRPFFLDNREPLQVAISLGIARYPDDADTAEGLLRAAALASQLAHGNPELSYEFYDRERGEHMRSRFRLEARLRQAIEEEQLESYYQPQVSMVDGRLVGLEALVRWPQADGSLVYPGDFIPLAEEIGLSGQLGRLMLRRVARDLRTWSDRGRRTVAVAVNCSARQLRDTSLIEAYTKEVLEQGIDPNLIHFEITESSLIDDLENAERTMARLIALGANFSIDDFGTGFSALSYLSRLPFRMLKVDRSFVHEVQDDPHQRRVVLGLIRMASTIGLYVVAEGVETAQEEAEMRRMGCDAAQGFYYSPALSADETEPWLESLDGMPRPSRGRDEEDPLPGLPGPPPP